MKKPNSRPLQKSLTLAATIATLGSSLGVPVEQALAAPLSGDPAQMKRAETGSVQGKLKKNNQAGANQLKYEKAGANQLKYKKAGAVQQKADKVNSMASPGSKSMLNPQPLPPKQRNKLGE